LSGYEAEEQRLRKLYDQARIQGDKKKKKEYKEKIAELNRNRKQEMRASRREEENEKQAN
jgi:hypothetical protein